MAKYPKNGATKTNHPYIPKYTNTQINPRIIPPIYKPNEDAK